MSSPMSTASAVDVCAVVVTYNRKDLLRECLQALVAQSQPLNLIWIFNNASTDGTLEMLEQEFSTARYPQIRVTTLERNSGGAGGFHEGVKQAAAAGYSWIWLMDDDTIPQPDALDQLFAARERFPAGHQPDLLASKVVWLDGTLHSMNISWVNQRDPEATFRAAVAQTIAIRSATFVSLLLHRRFVAQYGLPIADYFIWGDDVEYSGRILRKHLGVAVPASVVVHKTPKKHGSADASPRFYYHVRNGIWMMRHSEAFSFREKSKMWVGFVGTIFIYLKRAGSQGIGPVLRGLRDGLFRAPVK